MLIFQSVLSAFSTGAELNKRVKQIRDQVLADSKFNALTVFELLLNIGQFEFKLKEVSSYGALKNLSIIFQLLRDHGHVLSINFFLFRIKQIHSITYILQGISPCKDCFSTNMFLTFGL